jgi:hypothetical protein
LATNHLNLVPAKYFWRPIIPTWFQPNCFGDPSPIAGSSQLVLASYEAYSFTAKYFRLPTAISKKQSFLILIFNLKYAKAPFVKQFVMFLHDLGWVGLHQLGPQPDP